MSGFPLCTRKTILVVLFVFVGLVSAEEKMKDEAHSLKLLKETVPLKKLLEKAAHDEEISASNDVDGNEKKSDQLRQYGWGWGSPSYSSGGYDTSLYTLIAVAAFAALFGALFFELATGGSKQEL